MRLSVPIALLLALSLIVGCQQKADEPDVKVDLHVEPSPPAVGKAQVTVDLHDADGKPIDGATVRLEGNMAHAGMKPVFADATQQKPGVYRAVLEFTMAGDWFVVVSGKLPDGKPFSKKIDVKGVKAGRS